MQREFEVYKLKKPWFKVEYLISYKENIFYNIQRKRCAKIVKCEEYV